MDKRQRRAIEDQAFASLQSKLLTAQSLELAQLVKDVTDAKQALAATPALERAISGDDDGEPVALDDGQLSELVATLFEAIDKLTAFYKAA
jgi:hypothetical protein